MTHRAPLSVVNVDAGDWLVPALVGQSGAPRLVLPVFGGIGNSITTSRAGAQRTSDLKRVICSTVHGRRGEAPWDPRSVHLLSFAFRFHLPSHGGSALDVENYVKPTVDALAAGLFLEAGGSPGAIARYQYDDAGFLSLLITRLDDASTAGGEGVGVVIASP